MKRRPRLNRASSAVPGFSKSTRLAVAYISLARQRGIFVRIRVKLSFQFPRSGLLETKNISESEVGRAFANARRTSDSEFFHYYVATLSTISSRDAGYHRDIVSPSRAIRQTSFRVSGTTSPPRERRTLPSFGLIRSICVATRN